MRFFILNGLSTFLVFPILMSGTALSADLSAYEREGYDRILVEGSPLESIDKGDKAITITFREAKPSLNGVEAVGAAKSVQSAMQQGQTLTITFNDVVQSIRNFQIGNRLVIDVFYDRQLVENEPQTELAIEETTSTPTQVQTPEPSPTPINEPAAKPTEEQPKAEEQKVPEPENPAIEEKNTEQTSPQESPDDLQTIKEVDEPAPVLTDAEVLPELADATIVTVSSTSPFALAVFERYNRLFIVTDQEEMVVPPQIAGAGKDAKWKLSEVEIDGGRAWSMPIPGNAFIRPEGSGLVWRIVISDVDPQLKGADIRRRLADPSDLKIDIMMEDAVELLRLRDPDYGDDLAVVTVSRPQSRMLKPYDFVDFDVIPAVSGAVIKPESDGLRIVSTPQFVTVGKNGGLDMARESQNVVLQQVMKEEERAILDDADPEGDGGENSFDRVFFFTDWGGTLPGHEFVERRKELDQFLVDAPKQSKTGIIINMVKLSLAQGMGPETLGYLSLLEAVNPQIGETVEYKTMRGAAHFLARQYDRAEQYLKDPELDQITEVRLWRAATLAAQGQEEDAMDIYQEGDGKIAASYPYRIRMDVLAPLVLALVNEDKAKEALNLVHQVDEEGQRRTAGERATLAYLKGRANRMAGNIEESLSDLGQAALVDKLGPYGVRSEMMLIQDELNREVTDYDEAIKRM